MKTVTQILELLHRPEDIKGMKSNADLLKAIEKVSFYKPEQFCADCIRYINAVKEERMMCIIDKVSASGMSRTMKFVEMEVKGKRGRLYNFYAFFKATGHSIIKDSDFFRVNGCGMDMVFHVNYSLINRMERLGIITKQECAELAQKTPHKI